MTREEAIKILKNALSLTKHSYYMLEEWDEEAIRTLIKPQWIPQWIPVSERLPDDNKTCLVTFEGGYVDIMCYAKDLYKVDEYDFCAKKGKVGWYEYDSEWGYYSIDDVIAWMPLPEPYGAESEE